MQTQLRHLITFNFFKCINLFVSTAHLLCVYVQIPDLSFERTSVTPVNFVKSKFERRGPCKEYLLHFHFDLCFAKL